MHNEKLVIEIQIDFEKKILDGIDSIDSITAKNLNKLFENEREISLHEVSGPFYPILVTGFSHSCNKIHSIS